MPAQEIRNVAKFIIQQIQFVGYGLNFPFGAAIDVVVQLAADAISRVLPILTHHDHRSLDCCEHR